MHHELAAERTLLEQQINTLESAIEVETARLVVARAAGVRPRGLAAGVVIGALVVLAFIVVTLMWAMSTIGRMD
ncbi:MAG TPA: hypothetical protein VGH87_30825 [Polyangiaceae bacterium]